MYLPSELKRSTFPSIAGANRAIQKADKSGDDREARDLHSILFYMLNNDSELYSAVNVRKVAMTSFSWSIKPPEEDKNPVDSDLIRLHLADCINEFIRSFWKVPILGIYAAVLNWERPVNAWIPAIVKEYQPYELNWNIDADSIETYDEEGRKSRLITNDVNNFIVATSGEVPGGVLRRVMFDRILRHETLKDYANFNAGLKGLVDTTVADTADENQVEEAKTALATIHQNNFAVHSEDVRMEFKEFVSPQGSNSYIALIEKLDRTTNKAINGQANATELPKAGGSYAALQVLRMVSSDIVFDDFLTCEALVNEQIVLPYWRLNKDASATRCPYKFAFTWTEEQNPYERLQIAETVLSAGLPVMAIDIYEATGLTRPPDIDDVIRLDTVR